MKIIDYIKTKVRGTINLNQLKKDGLVVGKNFSAMEGVIIDPGHCWLIEIGNNVTLAPRSHILAHDASMKKHIGYTKIGGVKIGDNVFIGAGSIVLPNVVISDNTIIGAGSVISHSLDSGVYAGNPCKKIYEYDEWIEKIKVQMSTKPCYDESYKIGNISKAKKDQMKNEIKDYAYII
ncbi:acyltransferase [Lacrimispora sp.]|uniref:acyltransferase n=1 Tax=Lacrimispora sp. TaxID=2719234 RepID=UPI0032E4CB7D